MWGCGVSWYSLTYCLKCRGCWYGNCLRLHLWRWLGPIFILFHYFGLSFTCLKFGIFCDFSLEDVCHCRKSINFSVIKGANRAAGAGFSMRWSIMLPHGWLNWWKKFLAPWCSQEIILLCLQYVMIMCCKCILYNTSSAQLPVLCTSLVPCDDLMCAFCWFFSWTMTLVPGGTKYLKKN